MEFRTLRIGPAPDRQNEVLTPENGQGFLSWCMQSIDLAREELSMSANDTLNNSLDAHLANVLTFGLHPPEAVVQHFNAGPMAVYDFMEEKNLQRQLRRLRALEHAEMAMLIYGLRLLVDGTFWKYKRIESIGYDCYIFAAETLHSRDFDRVIYLEVASNFQRYGLLLNSTVEIMQRHPSVEPSE